jgi:hypothetical protein
MATVWPTRLGLAKSRQPSVRLRDHVRSACRETAAVAAEHLYRVGGDPHHHLAISIELPLASVCLWLSYHTHQLAERRIVLLLRRRRRGS